MRTLFLILILFLSWSYNGPAQDPNVVHHLNIKTQHVKQFLIDNLVHAKQAEKDHNIPPSVFLSQMGLESSWGRDKRAYEDCNFFGIKLNGEYAVFNSIEDCIRVYTNTLTNTCYQQKEKLTADDWFEALDRCGYAKDGPKYNCKLIEIIEDFKLYELDND